MAEASVFVQQQMAEPTIVMRRDRRRVAVFSDRAPNKTSANEDAAGVFPCGDDAVVLVVADGLGGASLGEAASQAAVEAIGEAIGRCEHESAQLRTAVLDGIEAANRAVIALGSGAATTLAVVEVTWDADGSAAARTYHVGDSGVFVWGGRGRTKLLTTAHSPVGYGVEAGLLDEFDAMYHVDRHVVSNVVGAADSRTEIGSTLQLAPRDTILLASDGLFDNLTTDEIVSHCRRGDAQAVSARLVEAARDRMSNHVAGTPSKPDDLTLIVLR